MWQPRFQPHAALEVRSDLIRSPILGGPQQLLFYATFQLEASFCPKKPFFIFGHKMGTHFGHPHKKFDPPMSLPVEKEHHMQILGRIGPTVSIKSGDLDCGLRQPRRSDLTSSGPPFWGVPNNFYFMQLFDWRPS